MHASVGTSRSEGYCREGNGLSLVDRYIPLEPSMGQDTSYPTTKSFVVL